jgi:hypothetical protein
VRPWSVSESLSPVHVFSVGSQFERPEEEGNRPVVAAAAVVK